METISYSDARAQLAATMDKVISDHAPVIITRHGSHACVLVSLDDWESMEETNYLRSSPANAQRLIESIRELEGGGAGIVTREAAEFLPGPP
jgi:antitoxin YefM